ncbi:hypothetical protein ACYOEI_21775 [Singulisphaera rosea]
MTVLSLALPGCGSGEGSLPKLEGETQPVKGKILLSDGKPLVGATVHFIPTQEKGAGARGTTGADGGFELTTREPGDGALAGDYKVRLDPPPAPSGVKKIPPPPFPVAYTDEDLTDLTATVNPGANDLRPIQLQNKVKTAQRHRTR